MATTTNPNPRRDAAMSRRYDIVGDAAAHMAASEQEWSDYGLCLSIIVGAQGDESIAWVRQVGPASVLGTAKVRTSAGADRR